jgi:hypothetical protein
MDAMPPAGDSQDLTELAEARQAAEARGDDAEVLRLRELELSFRDLPVLMDGARRTRLLSTDPLATTWEGWDLQTGQRVVMRCLRPRWARDPVMRRRMARVAELPPSGSIVLPTWRPDGDWPHTRATIPGTPLAERLPAEDPADPQFLARVLAGTLAAMRDIHAHGRGLGGNLAECILVGEDRVRLLWMDPFGSTPAPQTELAALGKLIGALDPEGRVSLTSLATDWVEHPPADAEGALFLFRRALAAHLLSGRHGLSIAARHTGRRHRAARLARLVRRLGGALPPPVSTVCLQVRADGAGPKDSPGGVHMIATSDGITVRGGPTVRLEPEALTGLPRIYHPDHGLDAAAGRQLLRAWALRQGGDEVRRQAAQERLSASDEDAAMLTRWLAAMARLRAARMLLNAESMTMERSPRRVVGAVTGPG